MAFLGFEIAGCIINFLFADAIGLNKLCYSVSP